LSSRKEQKEKLRQERLERERAAAASADRRRKLQIGGGAGILAVIVAVVVVIIVSSGGGGGGGSSTAASTKAGGETGVPAGAQVGLQDGSAPWQPEYTQLAQRLQAFNFPQQTDIGYHVHAQLNVYINGKQTTVPANVGIDPQGRFISPIHTHDTSGVVHMESTKYYPFTLGEFINVWGVYFTNNQLGGYKAGNGNVLQLWINNKQIADPVNYKMKPHDVMILGYGKPGSFPHKKTFAFGQL
jgi:hypothetical protein